MVIAWAFGQGRHGARQGLAAERGLVGLRENVWALVFGQRMRGQWAFGVGPAVTDLKAILSLPALHRAHGDATAAINGEAVNPAKGPSTVTT